MAEPSDKGGFPGADEREFYKLYRDRVEHEDTLIYQRLSWLITAQTIMFSFTAVAFFRTGAGEINAKGTVIMCVLGVLTCLVSYAGVLAALHAVKEIDYHYKERYPVPFHQRHPALPKLIGVSWTHRTGKLVPFVIPPMFILAWLIVLAIGLGLIRG
jgi:hypothetical protein